MSLFLNLWKVHRIVDIFEHALDFQRLCFLAAHVVEVVQRINQTEFHFQSKIFRLTANLHCLFEFLKIFLIVLIIGIAVLEIETIVSRYVQKMLTETIRGVALHNKGYHEKKSITLESTLLLIVKFPVLRNFP
jgi:hypothetical protein